MRGEGPAGAARGLVQRHVARWAAARRETQARGPRAKEVLKDYNGLQTASAWPPPPSRPLPGPRLRPPPPSPPASVPQETFFQAAASPGKPVPLRAAPSLGPTTLPQSKQAPFSLVFPRNTYDFFSTCLFFFYSSPPLNTASNPPPPDHRHNTHSEFLFASICKDISKFEKQSD